MSDKQKQRKLLLKNAIKENKLEYKWYGDCYSYVMYGKPSLDQVISNELLKMQNKTTRKLRLSKRLFELGITLDESLISCYNYINKVGCKSLDEIVRDVEIEHFFKKNTNCDELMKKNSMSLAEARDTALRDYLQTYKYKDNGDKVPYNVLDDSITVVFD